MMLYIGLVTCQLLQAVTSRLGREVRRSRDPIGIVPTAPYVCSRTLIALACRLVFQLMLRKDVQGEPEVSIPPRHWCPMQDSH